jgi:hypothetical protein
MNEITMEDIEKTIEDVNHAAMTMGFQSLDAYTRFKNDACEGMQRFGGEFARHLGMALFYADIKNSIKLMRMWHSLCEEHAMLYRASVAKQEAMKREDAPVDTGE